MFRCSGIWCLNSEPNIYGFYSLFLEIQVTIQQIGTCVKGLFEGQVANNYEDKFSVNDLLRYQGPCFVYMIRYLYCSENRDVNIQIGYSDAYELWIDNKLVRKREDVGWWTSENDYILRHNLMSGTHQLFLKLARRGENANFSMIITGQGVFPEFPDHYTDFSSINPVYW